MRTLFGMILGALLLGVGVYVHDSMQEPRSGGPGTETSRTIVNWDVAASEWNVLKARAHEGWIRISSR